VPYMDSMTKVSKEIRLDGQTGTSVS